MQFASCRCLFLGVLFSLCLNVNAQTADDIVGKWQNKDDKTFRIEISASVKDTYMGNVINDNYQNINRGVVLKKIVYDKETKKYIGKLSPPNLSSEIFAEIIMISIGELKITMHKFLLTKTIYLTRI